MIPTLAGWTWNRTLAEAMTAALMTRPAAALLTTPKLVLRSDNVVLTPDSPFSAITAVTLAGMGAATVTPSAPVHEGLGSVAVIASNVFIATAAPATPPLVVHGCALTDGVTNLYGGGLFNTPVNVNVAGDYIDLQAVLGWLMNWIFE